jgi:glycosyltransferase involved in cell wall biosynthesis
MNVLQIHPYYRPYGGAERYFFDLCGILEEAGHDIVILSSHDPENYHAENRKEYFIDRSFGLRTGFRVKRLIEDIVIRENPDLIHLHETFFFISPLIIQWLISYKPIVQTLHDSFFFVPRLQRYCLTALFVSIVWARFVTSKVVCRRLICAH